MSLKLNGTRITYMGNVKLNGKSLTRLTFNGNPIWLNTTTSGWATVWSGSRTFYDHGNFNIPGLSKGQSVRITANVKYLENIEPIQPTYRYFNYENIVLPQDLYYDHAYVTLENSGDSIYMEFHPYSNYIKGFLYEYTPEEITFTEVQIKL